MNRIWILGTSDPEMSAIETLLQKCKEPYVYACKDDKRVHAGIAYSANSVLDDTGNSIILFFESLNQFGAVHLVECGFTSEMYKSSIFLQSSNIKIFDHHREGDPGYKKSAKEYFLASSIGQVWNWLSSNMLLPQLSIDAAYELYMIAAADHCLMAAYQGKCPDVDPNELMEWRIRSKAAYRRRSIDSIMRNVNHARSLLRLGGPYCRTSISGELVADFGDSTIPELPEAAAREGIAFLATVTDADGRKKRVLQCASEKVIDTWMHDMQGILTDIYGDSVRGFAGGYIK